MHKEVKPSFMALASVYCPMALSMASLMLSWEEEIPSLTKPRCMIALLIVGMT